MPYVERFHQLMALDESSVPIDEAALLIGAHSVPGLDVAGCLGQLDELAGGCRRPTLDDLVEHLFVELGFRGNESTYYDPRNSYLHDVLRRRRGIPISLSVLAIAVGERIGVPLVGVGMPGHFLVRPADDEGCFLDPFAAGAQIDRAGCRAAFARVHGDEVPFDERYLAPVGTFAILARMLANLRSIFAAAGDREAITWVLRLRTAIPGVPLEERGELAAALAATGDFGGAAREFEQLADRMGGPVGAGYAADAIRLRAAMN